MKVKATELAIRRSIEGLTPNKEYRVIEVFSTGFLIMNDDGMAEMYNKDWLEPIVDVAQVPLIKPIDAHYTGFTYTLTEADKQAGVLKVDPYFVSKQWNLGAKDSTGVLFHCLKNISRYSDKNTKEREIRALHLQVKRLAELEGVAL